MARVLVIDDDELLVKLLVEALSRRGHEVTFALDGEAGESVFDEDHFDAVVCDIVMPEKEGIETIQHIRRARPDLGIVAVSGGLGWRAGLDILDFAKKLGADVALRKPFGMAVACDAVDQAIATRSNAVKEAQA